MMPVITYCWICFARPSNCSSNFLHVARTVFFSATAYSCLKSNSKIVIVVSWSSLGKLHSEVSLRSHWIMNDFYSAHQPRGALHTLIKKRRSDASSLRRLRQPLSVHSWCHLSHPTHEQCMELRVVTARVLLRPRWFFYVPMMQML